MEGMKPLLSSAKTDWETPQDLFNALNDIFEFDLDVCATEWNTKIPGNFISPEENAFVVPWRGDVCWMNPPYGKAENACVYPCKKRKCVQRGYHIDTPIAGIGDWMHLGMIRSRDANKIVVCLVPARTDTEWFQIVWSHSTLIAFLRGRYQFVGASSGATFPSCVCVFSYHRPLTGDVYRHMSDLGNVIHPTEGLIRWDGSDHIEK